MLKHSIVNIPNYPQDGNHQECILLDVPGFEIRKGEDQYYYHDKDGNEKWYNAGKKVDSRWIVHLTDDANPSLRDIFQIKVSYKLNIILAYCAKMYERSLRMEINRLGKELLKFKGGKK